MASAIAETNDSTDSQLSRAEAGTNGSVNFSVGGDNEREHLHGIGAAGDGAGILWSLQAWWKHASYCKRVSVVGCILLAIVFASFLGALGLFVALIFPWAYYVIRYAWLRLCRDPFLAQETADGRLLTSKVAMCDCCSIVCPKRCCEGGGTDSAPDGEVGGDDASQKEKGVKKLNVPTVVYLLWIFLCFIGAAIADPTAETSVAPNPATVFLYNGFGSLLILLVCVWAVDACFYFLPCLIAKAVAPSAIMRARVKAGATILLFIALISAAASGGYKTPRVVDVQVPLRDLPACADGYRIAMISDLHLGALVGPQTAQVARDLSASLSPDAIVLVGDMGDREVNDVYRDKFGPLEDLAELATDGAFWVSGNHENYGGAQGYRDLMAAHGIVNLENNHTAVGMDEDGECDGFDIAGIADLSGDQARTVDRGHGEVIRPNPTAALVTGRDSSRAAVLLSHQPARVEEFTGLGAGLVLSGHTHGGQVWPIHMTLVGYDGVAGLFEMDDNAFLYVSEGFVGWGPRLRFMSQSEITLITLRHPETFALEGLEADTSIRGAQAAYYFALIAVPLGLVLCGWFSLSPLFRQRVCSCSAGHKK